MVSSTAQSRVCTETTQLGAVKPVWLRAHLLGRCSSYDNDKGSPGQPAANRRSVTQPDSIKSRYLHLLSLHLTFPAAWTRLGRLNLNLTSANLRRSRTVPHDGHDGLSIADIFAESHTYAACTPCGDHGQRLLLPCYVHYPCAWLRTPHSLPYGSGYSANLAALHLPDCLVLHSAKFHLKK